MIISYFILSKANIPVQQFDCDMNKALLVEPSEDFSSCDYGGTSIEMSVSFPVYLVCLIAFVGWVLFIIFAGVGLTAIPLDFICQFRNRPRRMSRESLTREKNILLKNVTKLRENA